MLTEAINFIRGVREELKKVVWPSRELVVRASVAVVVFTAFFSIYLWILDMVFAKIVSLVFNKL
jgi:preprotein translocase subunit SecE